MDIQTCWAAGVLPNSVPLCRAEGDARAESVTVVVIEGDLVYHRDHARHLPDQASGYTRDRRTVDPARQGYHTVGDPDRDVAGVTDQGPVQHIRLDVGADVIVRAQAHLEPVAAGRGRTRDGGLPPSIAPLVARRRSGPNDPSHGPSCGIPSAERDAPPGAVPFGPARGDVPPYRWR